MLVVHCIVPLPGSLDLECPARPRQARRAGRGQTGRQGTAAARNRRVQVSQEAQGATSQEIGALRQLLALSLW